MEGKRKRCLQMNTKSRERKKGHKEEKKKWWELWKGT